MAIPTDVDGSAPVLAHHEVEIQGPLDTVWQLHIGVDESFAGDPVSADVAGMQGQLDASLVAWLDYLRSAAEGSD